MNMNLNLKTITVPAFSSPATPLCEIMAKWGSDKSPLLKTSRHNYTPFYHSLFSGVRDKPLRIFELGVGSGASLRGWKEFFPNASVFGGDKSDRSLFREERIETFLCDQTSSESLGKLWSDPALEVPMDIIIDDGLHTFESQVVFFENSISKLGEGGVFIIEDIHSSDMFKFNMIAARSWSKMVRQIRFLELGGNFFDNNLLAMSK